MKNTKSEANKVVLTVSPKGISMETKFLLKPVGIFLIIISLLIGSIYFSLGQINKVNAKIAESEKNETILKNKVGILRSITGSLPDDISFIDLSLPSKGIALYGMSQIKTQANSLGILISNLRTGSTIEDSGGVFKITVSFDVQGDKQLIYDYLALFPKMLPLMKVDKVSIGTNEGITLATVSVSAFGADLPTKIPSLTSPVQDLTSEELKTIDEISSYIMPEFVIPVPITETSKEDPFN